MTFIWLTAKGRYTLPVRTGRKERPYVRHVHTGVIFLHPYVRPVRTVDPYGPQESIFDTRKGHPYVRPVSQKHFLRNLWRYIVNKVIEAKNNLFC